MLTHHDYYQYPSIHGRGFRYYSMQPTRFIAPFPATVHHNTSPCWQRYHLRERNTHGPYSFFAFVGMIILTLILWKYVSLMAWIILFALGLHGLFHVASTIAEGAVTAMSNLLYPKKNSKNGLLNTKTGEKNQVKDDSGQNSTATETKTSIDPQKSGDKKEELRTIYQKATTRVEENNENQLVLSFELPGVQTSNVFVEVVDEDNDKMALKMRAERTSGTTKLRLHQKFHLQRNRFDLENIDATLLDGVLTVTLPKKPVPKPFSLSIVRGFPDETAENQDRLTFSVPGVKPENIKIEYGFENGHWLHVKGVRTFADGSLSVVNKRSPVGEGILGKEAAKAYLMDGVLTVAVPRNKAAQEEEKVKRVTVKSLEGAEEVVQKEKNKQPEGQVAAMQLARWAPQLIQLRELGFTNEALCVDVLERLKAANIGVESNDDVSVEQVVNELLRGDL